MDMGRELREALLRNWMDKDVGGPVYGALDADELAQDGKTTLATDGRRWCMVTAEDVRIVAVP
jgi:hypothetical protein